LPNYPPSRAQSDGAARKGRHFGPRPVADPRSARLEFRCTPAVRAKASAAAKAAGLSVAGYICALIDGQPGPRAHRNPDALVKIGARLAAQMGKGGSNLNQGARVLNRIAIAADEGAGRDRLADLLDEMAELHRQAIDEQRACLAAVMRDLLAMRPGDDY